LAKSHYFQKVEIRETSQEDVGTTRQPSPGSGGRQALPQAPIPVKKFLIESTINYLPSLTQQITPSGTPAAKDPAK